MKHPRQGSVLLTFLVAMAINGVRGQEIRLPITDQAEFLNNLSNSGFDVWFGYREFLNQENIRPFVSSGLISSRKTLSFSNHLIFNNKDGELLMVPDQNPDHDYPDQIFHKGYSRLTAEYLGFDCKIGIGTDLIYLSTGPVFLVRINSVACRKWYESGEKKRERVSGNDLLELNDFLASWQLSLNVAGINLTYEYCFSNFFRESWGLKYNFHGFFLGCSYDFPSNK